MVTIPEKRRLRRLILRQLYEVSDPVSGFHVRPGDVIGALSDQFGAATGPDCDNAIGYLEADGLVERPSHDQLRITRLGVRVVEEEDAIFWRNLRPFFSWWAKETGEQNLFQGADVPTVTDDKPPPSPGRPLRRSLRRTCGRQPT